MHDQFGRYILEERIAIGGMAEIFRAKAPGLGGFEKILAIKRLHPRYSQDADFIEMLIDEARITVELTHSNVGQIFDLGKVDDHYFIAMEFIDGRDLYRAMKRLRDRQRAFPIDVAAFVAMETAAGLDYAHRKKDSRSRPLHIIHRDVSPQNVLLSFDGEVKIVDFGIAKAALRAYETESGIIKGKFYYMSPEQARGEPLDHRTDIFSLGIVLYEMLTGELLYKDDDEVTLLSRVRRAEIEPPSRVRPDLPQAIERIAMKALARDRAERYPSAQHMNRDLARFLREFNPTFARGNVGGLMRELFLNESPQAHEPVADSVLRNRDEFGLDRQSVISFGHFTEADDETAIELEGSQVSAVSLSLGEGFGSDLMELDADDIELVEDSGTLDFVGATPSLEAYDSVEFSEETVEADAFESEDTRAFVDRARPVRAPGDEDRPLSERVTPPAQAVPMAARAVAAAPTRDAAPTVVALRAAAPAASPRDARRDPPAAASRDEREGARDAHRGWGQGEEGVSRQQTVIVEPEPAPAPAHARGRLHRAPATGATLTASEPRGVVFGFTRERLLLASLFLFVIVGAAVATSLVVDRPQPVSTPNPSQITMGTQAPPPPVVPGTGTLVVRSTPSAAEVKIDGQLRYEKTPTQYELPAERPVRVQVLLPGYEVYETQVVLPGGGEKSVEAVLERVKGTLSVESRPGRARVVINGQEVGETPLTRDQIPTDRDARVVVTKEGFLPHESFVQWGSDAERVIKVDLKPIPEEPVAVVRPPEPDRDEGRVLARAAPVEKRPAARRAPRSTRASARPAPRPRDRDRWRPAARPRSRTSGGGVGYLSVTAKPWGAVFVNGKRASMETPLHRYSLAPGEHDVYVNYLDNEAKRSRVKRITIIAGRESKLLFP